MTQKHSFREDLLALLVASGLVSLGVFLFKQIGLLTGGTAGLTLLATQLTGYSFGELFFLFNLPFYWLAYSQMGKRFTLNTFISVSVVSFAVDNLHRVLDIQQVDPFYAAVMGGALIGLGMLIMFRHASSLGGFGILALYLQGRRGIAAGKVQMGVDCAVLVASFFIVDIQLLLLSILGALTCNLVVTFNHKPGRYQVA